MSYTQGLFPVLKRTACAKNTFDYTVLCPEIAAQAEAGQFVHIRCAGFSLRRPISICGVDREKGTLRIVFEVRGEGTSALSQIPEGGMMDLLGPLGHGFALLAPEKKAVVVGGGIGVPPLLETIRQYGENGTAFLGFRSAGAVILEDDFRAAGAATHIATDDGSYGHKGFVTELLARHLEAETPDILYTCGPAPMIKLVAGLAKQHGVRCQVSLEERMGCGVGACLVCACKTKKADGGETYSHVCKDGPVFEAEEVCF